MSGLSNEEQYSSEYYEEKHRNWFAHPNWILFARIERAISAHAPAGTMLDVGCGRGDLLRFMRARNSTLTLTGIDLSDIAPDSEIEFVRGDFLTWRDARRFDAVVSLATIEHVADVRGFVVGMMARTKPGGLLLIMTLNDRSVLYAVARAMGQIGLDTPAIRLYDRHHVNHFTGSSLRRLMEVCGLSVVEVSNHNAPMAAIDFEAKSGISAAVMRTGVRGSFALGSLIGRTYLQTVIARLPL